MGRYKIHGGYDPDYRLCLVRGDEAVFANGHPNTLKGDDWNDCPASCNAGYPQNVTYFSVKIGDGLWCPTHHSADQYNARHAPWLVVPSNEGKFREIPVGIEIYAGITFKDFVNVCAAIGSHVQLPVDPA